MTDTDKEKIKTEKEFCFKIDAMCYDFAKQRYIALMPILVAALGLIAFAIDRLNIMPVLKTSAMTPSFKGLVVTIVSFFVAIFSFFKPKYSAVVGVFLVMVMVAVVVSGLFFAESVAGIMIASSFCLYAVFTFFALCITYSCLLNLEKHLERQAETKDCEIRKLQSNTDREREDIEKKRQECENNEKKRVKTMRKEKENCLIVSLW